MSSRILHPDREKQARPLVWRQVGTTPEPDPPDIRPPSPASQQEAAKPPPEPQGPSWQDYRALESRLAECQQQLPIREQQARQAGLRDGEAAAMAKWEAAMERISRSIAEMAALRTKMRRESEEDVVRLSMAMARRVLRRELTVDPESLLGLVKSALERIELREMHRVRVRPEDAPLVTRYLERIGSPHRIEISPDTSLERGGAIFETQRGNLDVSLETQLEEIERGFADLLRKPGAR